MAVNYRPQLGEYLTPIPDGQQYARIDKRSGAAVLTPWSIQANRQVYEPNERRTMAANAAAIIPSVTLDDLVSPDKRYTMRAFQKLLDKRNITGSEGVRLVLEAQMAGLLVADEPDAATVEAAGSVSKVEMD